MYKDLNTVKPKVRLDGEELAFESVTLCQEVNSCHHFEVVLSCMSQSDLWSRAELYRKRVGAALLIRLEHRDGSGEYEFSGVVTGVTVEALDGDGRLVNHIRIVGGGDVVSLDGTLGRASFVDCQLCKVVLQQTEGAGFKVVCEPRFQAVLPYLMRYDESAFAFLNRLSALFGEWFFYDGRRLHFGEPADHRAEVLLFDEDLLSLRTVARAVPSQPSYYDYYLQEDVFATQRPNPQVPGSVDDLRRKSDYVYRMDGSAVCGAPLLNSSSLSDWADRRQLGAWGGMFGIEGESNTCRVRLGGLIEVAFPRSAGYPSLGCFRVVSLHHRVDKSGNYRNRFEAVPEGFAFAPPREPLAVRAYPELAVVSDNADPKGLGRVRVQFDWQKPLWKSTGWLRVVSPSAGGSEAVPANRGVLFVPEVGDHVMVGFEHGDPNRPYVMGSLFSGSNGRGGGEANAVKGISTASGHHIVFNDDRGGAWGVTIADPNGNCINLSSSQRTIVISSQENIVLRSKNITLEAEEDIEHKSGKNFTVSAGDNYELSVEKNASTSVKGDSAVMVDGDYKRVTNGNSKVSVVGSSACNVSKTFELKVDSDTDLEFSGKLNCDSSGDSELRSKSTMYLIGKGSVYVGK